MFRCNWGSTGKSQLLPVTPPAPVRHRDSVARDGLVRLGSSTKRVERRHSRPLCGFLSAVGMMVSGGGSYSRVFGEAWGFSVITLQEDGDGEGRNAAGRVNKYPAEEHTV